MEGAKIHAENSIRQKNQALNYRRMSARIDAVAARVQTAITTKQACLSHHSHILCCDKLSIDLQCVSRSVHKKTRFLYLYLVNFVMCF